MPLFRKKPAFEGGGLVLFEEVSAAMRAEKVLRAAGYRVRLVAPPPELRKGCDLALEINLVEQPGVARALKDKDAAYVEIAPRRTDTAALLEIVKMTDFGDWLMARAGNMKITFAKATGVIVNVSGGGCPDIPYMHAALLDKPLQEAPRPRDLGFTLCALNAERALEECQARRNGGEPA